MKKKKVIAMILSMMLAMGLCACGKGAATTSNTDSSADTKAAEKTTEVTETTETAEAGSTAQEKSAVTLPEDKGMAGVYKWVEMAGYGVDSYLLLWDDGTGLIDMVGTGTVTDVSYDDKTMQAHDEGAVLQNYTYADDKLTWSYTDNEGEHVSTFVKLTAQERAAYEALGVGSVTDQN